MVVDFAVHQPDREDGGIPNPHFHISEQQARLKELEQKKLEAENSEIVDIVRGMSISLTELPLLFEKLKDGGTLGQSVPKSEEKKKEEN